MKKLLSCITLVIIAGFIQASSIYDRAVAENDDFFSLSLDSTLSKSDEETEGSSNYNHVVLSVLEDEKELSGTPVFIEPAHKIFPVMQNGTERDVSIMPDICDVENIEAIREEYGFFPPRYKFRLDSDFIQDSLHLRKQVQGNKKRKTLLGQYQNFDLAPVVIVAYNTSLWENPQIRRAIEKHQDYRGFLNGVGFINYIGFLNEDADGFLLFKTMKRYYYKDIYTEKEFIEENLPHPFLKIRVGSLYPYPFIVKEESKKLDPNLTYELFINTTETRVIQNSRIFICVEDFLDIRSI